MSRCGSVWSTGDVCNGVQGHPGSHVSTPSPKGIYYVWSDAVPEPTGKDQVTSRKYAELGERLGALVDTKQHHYGNSFGKAGEVLKILYPNGISHAEMDDVLTIARVLDKLFRVATDRDALGESPWRDVAGYALLAAARKE